MPTVFRIGPYRFFFYSGDRNEPIHVHVERDGKVAKFWVKPIRLSDNTGYAESELSKIRKIILEHEQMIVESWHDYFSN
uniref:DUF4160 domain-containing protein n=1 Tax=Candidatus Kentrum sp. UNK TaxID=2126344 RepID=A0A451AL36_9GAMM|nr:MAG: protein of unknown function (DUF4160) [Candidatus Kentron sp. UNK]VFK72210.1 MAG: protein of unknown function (DUF4160) [Candidatus Kentron sp. UNK]